jgi:hypothetical protein
MARKFQGQEAYERTQKGQGESQRNKEEEMSARRLVWGIWDHIQKGLHVRGSRCLNSGFCTSNLGALHLNHISSPFCPSYFGDVVLQAICLGQPELQSP